MRFILLLLAVACTGDKIGTSPAGETGSGTAPGDTDPGDTDPGDTDVTDTDPDDTAETDPVDTGPGDTDTDPAETDGETGGDTDPGLVADSVADYSGVQGQNGWYYGFIRPDVNAEWQPMPSYLSGGASPGWYADPAHTWTSISADSVHPNGEITTEGRSPVEEYAVRRWVSDEVGLLHVTSHIAKVYADGLSNGVLARVAVDGIVMKETWIEGWNTTGYDVTIDVVALEGTVIDFVMDPNESTDLSDRTFWTISISR
jgi:hypothetical protein